MRRRQRASADCSKESSVSGRLSQPVKPVLLRAAKSSMGRNAGNSLFTDSVNSGCIATEHGARANASCERRIIQLVKNEGKSGRFLGARGLRHGRKAPSYTPST